MKEPKFYAVGEKEILKAETIDEAIEEYLEYVYPHEPAETVTVQGYAPKAINGHRLKKVLMEVALEYLDENYGPPDEPSDYNLSDEADTLLDKFAQQVVNEYPVWICEPVGEPIEVKLSEYKP